MHTTTNADADLGLLLSRSFLATRRRREAYVFVQYFFIYWSVSLGPQSGGYGGPPGIFGDRGAGHAPAGGCRANNVR